MVVRRFKRTISTGETFLFEKTRRRVKRIGFVGFKRPKRKRVTKGIFKESLASFRRRTKRRKS